MSALERMAAQMREMDRFFGECEPLPEPGQIIGRDGWPIRSEAAAAFRGEVYPPYTTQIANDPLVRSYALSEDLRERMSAVARELAHRRAQAIDDWFREECAKILDCPEEQLVDETPEQTVVRLRVAGIGLLQPTPQPPGEEIFVVTQNGVERARMRLRTCLGSDGCVPRPVD